MDKEVAFFILVLYDPKRGRSAPYATLFMHTYRIRDVLAPSSLGTSMIKNCNHNERNKKALLKEAKRLLTFCKAGWLFSL